MSRAQSGLCKKLVALKMQKQFSRNTLHTIVTNLLQKSLNISQGCKIETRLFILKLLSVWAFNVPVCINFFYPFIARIQRRKKITILCQIFFGAVQFDNEMLQIFLLVLEFLVSNIGGRIRIAAFSSFTAKLKTE